MARDMLLENGELRWLLKLLKSAIMKSKSDEKEIIVNLGRYITSNYLPVPILNFINYINENYLLNTYKYMITAVFRPNDYKNLYLEKSEMNWPEKDPVRAYGKYVLGIFDQDLKKIDEIGNNEGWTKVCPREVHVIARTPTDLRNFISYYNFAREDMQSPKDDFFLALYNNDTYLREPISF